VIKLGGDKTFPSSGGCIWGKWERRDQIEGKGGQDIEERVKRWFMEREGCVGGAKETIEEKGWKSSNLWGGNPGEHEFLSM